MQNFSQLQLDVYKILQPFLFLCFKLPVFKVPTIQIFFFCVIGEVLKSPGVGIDFENASCDPRYLLSGTLRGK